MKKTLQNPWFWATIIIVAVVIFRSCSKGQIGFFGCNGNDTVSHKIDTVITVQKSDTVYIPQEKNTIVYVPKWFEKERIVEKIVPDYQYLDIKGEDTCAAVMVDYSKPKYYDDTLRLKNGTVTINEIVNNNMIINRKVGLETSDTSIHETTTILKHKIILYFGMKVFSQRTDFLHQAEINLGIKGKNDMQYTAGIGRVRGEKENIYSFEVKLPIRLFTKKR